ncbi:FtsW/RodA/SpoVE family cell cycle protein [Acidaminobacter hydrogenoformans]|uniref:Cell division protein FtsW, lipid II flippase n=1 Tax=Acidaminobacter hydrogenoformans DSM 2784 TaxID=1120920 RepID=A0A1G5RWH5_9FIRM|nr:FtsW/RodA/SpoVE family cell cycle protein [Acidaminobacter hydrogenoformans]SCZ77659.1 cell division protein FtsW, lipid II flippase [Acidaminobacter hydrogenoformans DSM 2784]
MKAKTGTSLYTHFWGPLHLVALTLMLLFGQLALMGDPIDFIPLIMGGSMLLLVYFVGWVIRYNRLGDPYLWTIVAMLISLGLAMQYRLSPFNGIKQFNWILIGILTYLVAYGLYAALHERFRSVYFHYALLVGLFAITLIFGTEINGAKNWLKLGTYSFQPSELGKIIFVFFMAACVTSPERLRIRLSGRSFDPKLVMMGLVYLLMGLFAVQREFGTAMLVFGVYMTYIYVFERDVLFTLYNLGIVSLLGLAAFKVVSHIEVRVDTWLNPWADPGGAGYQITQSLFAIGSGGFFGSGIGQGYPKFIPAVRTDFIFAAICEEMGILGGIAVILLFFILIYRGIKLALRIEDRFMKAVAFGLTMTLGYQTFIIIGGVTKLIPLTGITLPFLSYGGSSMMASFATLGLLQALSGQILRREAETLENGYRQ